MCWSLRVSLVVTVLEACALAFLVWRCFASASSTQPAIRSQRYWVPVMANVFAIEAVETLL